MIRAIESLLRRFLSNTDGVAAVEAAIFSPIFVLFALGVADLGSEMFVQMTVNAAAQAGAAYAVINSGSTCASLTTTCLNSIKAAMEDATGNASFCAGSVCAASITSCADCSPRCIIVSVNYTYSPILPDVVYLWARSTTISSTVTVRIL